MFLIIKMPWKCNVILSLSRTASTRLQAVAFLVTLFFPFERTRYVQLSNDEQAVVFATAGDVNGVRYNIFRLDCYEERSRMHTVWLTYTFTEADFRDGVPVTEESDTDY